MGRAKEVDALEAAREKRRGRSEAGPGAGGVFAAIRTIPGQEQVDPQAVEIGCASNKPGDGSAGSRRPAASGCWGGLANITQDYAKKPAQRDELGHAALPSKGEPPI